jgi:hypothetical protein
VIEVFFLFIILITISTFNIPYVIFVLILLLYSRFNKNIYNNELNYLIIFIIALPSGFRGQNPLNLNLLLILIIILYLIKKDNKNISLIPSKEIQYYFISLFILATLVYLPILFSTYLGFNFFDSSETLLLSNNRPSHMFGFAAPLLFIGFFVISNVSFFSTSTNFNKLFKILYTITIFVIILSIIRFISNINLIPQDYAEIRYDGNRFTGITNPDSLGFARSLLFPLAITASFYFSNLRNKQFAIIFLLILFSLYATISRTVFISTTIIIFTSFLYNYKKENFKFFLLFSLLFLLILLISGFGTALLARNSIDGELNVSGRDSMWLTAIYVLTISPFTGLRPGGWQVWLDNGVEWKPGANVVVQSTHSFYLETAVAWGIPITLFIISLILFSFFTLHKFILIYKNHRHRNFDLLSWAIGIQCITIGLFFHGITENIHIYQWFTVISFSIALKLIIKKQLYENFSSS